MGALSIVCEVFMSRLQAFALHLLISGLIFIVLFAVLWLWFFPGALFAAAGGWQGVKIIALVDMVLGPCLTLIVFNPRKPRGELCRDLGIVGLVQLLALLGGLYAIQSVRPLLVVQVYDTLYVHNQESLQRLDMTAEQRQTLLGVLPRFYYVEVPREQGAFLQDHVKGLLSGALPAQDDVTRYQAWPDEASARQALLYAATEQAGCLRLDVESAYASGSVCVDAQSLRLSDFVAEAPEH